MDGSLLHEDLPLDRQGHEEQGSTGKTFLPGGGGALSQKRQVHEV